MIYEAIVPARGRVGNQLDGGAPRLPSPRSGNRSEQRDAVKARTLAIAHKARAPLQPVKIRYCFALTGRPEQP